MPRNPNPAHRLSVSNAPRRRHGSRSPGRLIETVEPRILFHLEVAQPIADQLINLGSQPTVINLSERIFNEESGPTVRMVYPGVGTIDILLLEKQAPKSVANFVNYVNAGTFNNTIIHRSEPGFVIQGGGFTPTGADITPPGTTPVQNEFSPQRSNIRGTVAYAKLGSDPNSATSEFFYNLADNSSNLDNQNGGFTVFGRVVGSGMTVADGIASMQRVNATHGGDNIGGLNDAFNHLPVTRTTDPALTPVDPATGNGPSDQRPTTDQMVVLSSASVIKPANPITYSAISSNNALVQPVITSNGLFLNYGAGQTGTATITVTATEAETGAVVTDSFTVSVAALEVNLGAGVNAQSVQFRDNEGTLATLTVRGGSATVKFSGTGINQSSQGNGRTVLVTGGSLDIGSLTLSGPAPSATLTTVGGDGRVLVHSITAANPVRGIRGAGIDLRGPAVFSNGVGRLDIGRVQGTSITIQRAEGARVGNASVTIGEARDASIDSQQPLGLVRIGSFGGTDGTADAITAPAIANLQVNGDFAGALNVSGTGQQPGRPALGSTRISGALASGAWNVGKATRILAGSVGDAWSGTFGDVANFTVAGDLAGDLTASSINVLNAGSITGANITLNRAAAPRALGLGRLTTAGPMTNALIQSTADIGTVTAGAINGSSIYAGVVANDGGFLPTGVGNFTSSSTIRGVTVRNAGTSPGFANSDIAAAILGRMNLGVVQTDNAGVPFGLAATAIASLTAVGAGGTPIRLAGLIDPTQSLDQGDFEVRIF